MTDSKMLDYIAGKSEGPLAAAEAALEHIAGYLGAELDENAKLRAEIERLRAAIWDHGEDKAKDTEVKAA